MLALVDRPLYIDKRPIVRHPEARQHSQGDCSGNRAMPDVWKTQNDIVDAANQGNLVTCDLAIIAEDGSDQCAGVHSSIFVFRMLMICSGTWRSAIPVLPDLANLLVCGVKKYECSLIL